MEIRYPSDEEVAETLSDKAYRFPEKAGVTLPGDGGVPVRVPLILGNPSGACKLPPGMPPMPAWRMSVAATLKLRADGDGVADQLAADCVLWPDQRSWNALVNRWPALPGLVLATIRKKYGGDVALLKAVPQDEKPEGEIAVALAAHPHAVRRRFSPLGTAFEIVVDPPQSGAWRGFVDAVTAKDADAWVRASEMASACVVASGMPFATAIDRWPGLALLVVNLIGELIGASAEVELGGF